MIIEKHCTKCDKVKPAIDLWKDKRAKSSLQSYSRKCMKSRKPVVNIYKLDINKKALSIINPLEAKKQA